MNPGRRRYSTLSAVASKNVIDGADRDLLEILPLTTSAARCDSFVIVDEAQSLGAGPAHRAVQDRGRIAGSAHPRIAQRDNLRVGGTTALSR
jgi:hypothetical protein